MLHVLVYSLCTTIPKNLLVFQSKGALQRDAFPSCDKKLCDSSWAFPAACSCRGLDFKREASWSTCYKVSICSFFCSVYWYSVKLMIWFFWKNSPKHEAFTIGTSKTKDSKEFELYITTAPIPDLNDKLIVFGRVIRGEDVVQEIEEVDTDEHYQPKSHVGIINVTLKTWDFENVWAR